MAASPWNLVGSWLDDLSCHVRMQHTKIFNRARILKVAENVSLVSSALEQLAITARPHRRDGPPDKRY